MQELNQQYWDNRYLDQQTGWDIGYPSTPLKEYIDQIEEKSMSVLIPGSGNSFEAEYLLQRGFNNLTLIDIAPAITRRLEKKFHSWLGKQLTIITSNFFDLDGQYDLILEQTFFCALDPSFRLKYVQKMIELLKPGGKLAGVLFDKAFEGGPPFGGNREEYMKLFKEVFLIEKMEPCYNSIPPRAGTELFIKMKKVAVR